MPLELTTVIDHAIAASRNAYAPYSSYRVGAALVDSNGAVHTAGNVENAVYPATICAERSAVVKAVSEGVQDFSLIVVATQNGGTPCGICRQVLSEFSPTMRVVCCDFEGHITLDTTLDVLLPNSFSINDLHAAT